MSLTLGSSILAGTPVLTPAVDDRHGAKENAGEPTAQLARPLIFEEIYRRWFADVLRWCRALGGPDMDCEDLAQEVFVVVRRKLAAFKGDNVAGWLYTIASFAVRDYRQRAWFRHLFRRRVPLRSSTLETSASSAGAAPGPDRGLDRRDQRRLLHHLLARLSEVQRIAFLLFELEGYSIEQIAEMQRIPIATVSTRLHYARKKMAQEVQRLGRCGGL